MKRGLLWLGFVVVCLPMMVAVWLLVASSWSGMDGVTRHLPVSVKRVVAASIVNMNQNRKKAWMRAEKLDHDAAKVAETQSTAVTLSTMRDGTAISNVDGKVVIPETINSEAQALQTKAQELQKAHDYCGAEDLYTRAAGQVSSSNYYWYTEGMGKTGLMCGDLGGARAGLETSLEMADKYLAANGDDEDDVAETKKDMLAAREYLIVVYDRQKEKALSAQTCKAAHPEWRGCGCAVKGDGVKCAERR